MSIAETLEVLELLFASPYGYALIILSSFVEMTPLGGITPGGTIVAVGGFFSYSGQTSLAYVLISGWLGAWSAFLLAYYLGSITGDYFAKLIKQEDRFEKAKSMVERYGFTILTTSMMAGLTRFWMAYLAGSQRYKFLKFVFYSGVASLTWNSLMAAVGYLAGTEREKLESGIAGIGVLSWVFLFVLGALIYWKARKGFKNS